MKQVSLIWSLLIILIIFLESMNTASAIKCYKGLGKKDVKTVKEECGHGEDWCLKVTDGEAFYYGCSDKAPGDKEGCHDNKNDKTGRTDTACVCKTDGCNGSTPLGQMSRWLFFSLSIMVPWMSRALFAHSDISN